MNRYTLMTLTLVLAYNPLWASGEQPSAPFFLEPDVHLTAGTQPYFMASADLHKDGTPTLLVVNQVSDDLVRFERTAKNTWEEIERRPTGGKTPTSIAIQDLDGDGFLDVVISNLFSSNLAIFWNDHGKLTSPTIVSDVEGPRFVVAKDMNADGTSDLVVANQASESVSVLSNLGSRQFKLHSRCRTEGTFAFGLAVGDLNGDKSEDVVVGNLSSHDVSVLLNDGRGQLKLASRQSTGARTQIVCLGDIDGDGSQDIVAANGISDTVSILFNDGKASFRRQDLAVPTPQAVTLVDLDSNNTLDIVTANQGHSTVSVFLNRGGGRLEPRLDFAVGAEYPIALCTGDFNADGKPDIATANFGYGNVSILINGVRTTRIVETYPSPHDQLRVDLGGKPERPFSVRFSRPYPADARIRVFGSQSGLHEFSATLTSNQAELTAVAADPGRPFLSGEQVQIVSPLVAAGERRYAAARTVTANVTAGKGTGRFHQNAHVDVQASPSVLAAGDFNGDGILDIVYLDKVASHLGVVLGQGKGIFKEVGSTSTGGVYSRSIIAGDIDADGKLDIVSANTFSSNISILYGKGDGTFERPRFIPVGAGPRSVAVADINADGNLDIVTANQGGYSITTIVNQGNRVLTESGTYPPDAAPFSVTTADLNGDGAEDIITANLDSDTASLFFNEGNGKFRKRQHPIYMQLTKLLIVVPVDVNNDGHTDLLPVNMNSQNVALLINHGDGTFDKPKKIPAGVTPSFVVPLDIDADGKMDLAVMDEGVAKDDGAVLVLRNQGGGDFQEHQRIKIGSLPSNLVVGDFNQDGAVDIVVSDPEQRRLIFCLNSPSTNLMPARIGLRNTTGESRSVITAAK